MLLDAQPPSQEYRRLERREDAILIVSGSDRSARGRVACSTSVPGMTAAAAVAIAPVVMYERWAVCIDMSRPTRSASDAAIRVPPVAA